MIVWVVALRPEADPLVEARRLESVGGDPPWPLYRRGDDEALVVTGVGRNASAAACGWVLGRLSPPGHAGWINVGIAGHSEGPVGRPVIARRVVEDATGRSWYPPPLAELDRAPGDLLPQTVYTVDRPEEVFERQGAYDMEASGFLTAVGRAATAELAQVVKVVSDCPGQPAATLDRRRIGGLVEARLDTLAAVVESLKRRCDALASRAAAPPGYELLLERLHFTVTQRRQLRRLLERHAALRPVSAGSAPSEGGVDAGRPLDAEVLEARDARSALRRLTRRVEAAALERGTDRG